MTLPNEFTERIKTQLPNEELEAFLESYETDRSYGLRYNPLKLSREAFCGLERLTLTPVPWADEGFFYEEAERPGRHVLHEAGGYYIQEPSAMLVGSLADARAGERVLDLCAAPGGKSTHLAGRMHGEGILISNEIHPQRSQILAQNMERMGVVNSIVTNADSATLAEHFPGYFDLIVVDAPCSGEGMFRKEPEALTNWSTTNVEMCAARQKEILVNAMQMLRSGGRLVYSTCTFAPAEDEEIIAWLLEQYPQLEIRHFPELLSEGVREGTIPGTLRMWPHLIRGEGHFVCVLQDTSGKSIDDGRRSVVADGLDGLLRKAGRGGKHKEDLQSFEHFCTETLDQHYLETMHGELTWFGDRLYLLPTDAPSLAGLTVKRAGLELGEAKKNRFEPAHAWALSLHAGDVKCAVELTNANGYIAGNTDQCDPAYKGWVLCTTDGLSIGWGKAAGGVIKNHYPKGLRKNTCWSGT